MQVSLEDTSACW